MSDPNGWFDPARPGYPPNPEKDADYTLVSRSGQRVSVRWKAERQHWEGPFWAGFLTPTSAGKRWRCFGPAMQSAPDALCAMAEEAWDE